MDLTPRWSLYLGARWEGIRTTTTGNTFNTGRSSSSVWSPVMQTLFKIPDTKGDQLRFAVTRTYRAPSFQQLIPRRQTSIDNRSTDPDFAGNPDLKPELALGFDASYEHYWAEGAMFSISGSMRRIDDYTRYLVNFDGARWVAMPMNAGRATTRGLELETKFPLKALMKDAPAIDLRASVSANWSRVDGVPGRTTASTARPRCRPTSASTTSAPTSAPAPASPRSRAARCASRSARPPSSWRGATSKPMRSTSSRRSSSCAWPCTNLLGQDFVNRSSFVEEGRGPVLRDSVFEAGPSLRATLELKF